MTTDETLGYADWCRRLFDSLAEGGKWGVPRSGLVFRRENDELVLSAQMPHDPLMPLSPEELRTFQEEDFGLIRRHFADAGINVRHEDSG